MLNIKLDKELASEKKQQDDKINGDTAIKEVKLLMDISAAEDLRISRGLGKDHVLSVMEEQVGKQMELENLDKAYAGNVYMIDKIEKLAINYNLRFFKSTFFTGKIDIQAISKIKEFAGKTNAQINDAVLGNCFYILAPESQFQLQDKIVYRKQLFMPDPVMFYRIDENHYRLIWKWGSDFTVFRLISGLRWRSYWSFLFVTTFIYMPIIALFWALLLNPAYAYVNPIWTGVYMLVFSFAASFFRSIEFLDSDGEIEQGFFSKESWNSSIKTRRG